MGPRMVFFILMISNVALASPVSQLFAGNEAVHVTSKDSINNPISRLIVQKIEEYGINATNYKAHGYGSYAQYVNKKGRNAMSVIYFDIRNLVKNGDDIRFDFVYTPGTDVMVEEATDLVVANCHGTNVRGQIKLRLNECIAKALEQ